jgi:hypothetical protein
LIVVGLHEAVVNFVAALAGKLHILTHQRAWFGHVAVDLDVSAQGTPEPIRNIAIFGCREHLLGWRVLFCRRVPGLGG